MTTDEKPMLHVNIIPNKDAFIGECIELPLVVEGSTDEEVAQKMHKMAVGYFDVFPEKKAEVFSKKTITIAV